MKKIVLYAVAFIVGIVGTGFAVCHVLLWNDAGAGVATLAGAGLVAALIAPAE